MNVNAFKKWPKLLIRKIKPADVAGTRLSSGLKHIVAASFIVGVLMAINLVLSLGLSSVLSLGLSPVVIVMGGISWAISAIILLLIGGGIIWAAGKVLGGKGTYENFVGVFGVLNAALIGTLNVLIAILAIIGTLAGPAAADLVKSLNTIIILVMLLYSLYFIVKTLQVVHKLSLGKAIVAILLVVVVFVVLAFLLAVTLAGLIFGAMSTASVGPATM